MGAEAIILIGLQASGKTSFYQERFFATHVRISLDLLRTRHREKVLLDACLATRQPLVIDNTNPTREERTRYITAAREARFAVHGYYFSSRTEECLERNRQRGGSIPDLAILSTAKRLERPCLAEGFDTLFYVQLHGSGFAVENWIDSEGSP